MHNSQTQEIQPPPGYPTTENQPTGKKMKCIPQTKKKGDRGDRGFIQGCLFALCCCWLCEACF
ncbi:hypothetical protein Dsin_011974 [Dipteronia sinensis]|uniref:Cysteine-rich transmembrane domain-containing protein n=1 Tax=Dipteronia sinensis TaxID=43782 RepID=A0AAE0E7Q9_9ROSI|nr:hypothetical protein Dsin_011974 [Dipteronia sinensis]